MGKRRVTKQCLCLEAEVKKTLKKIENCLQVWSVNERADWNHAPWKSLSQPEGLLSLSGL